MTLGCPQIENPIQHKESDLTYVVLTANANMSDGVALFHATHKKLKTAAALSVTSLGSARAAMRKHGRY